MKGKRKEKGQRKLYKRQGEQGKKNSRGAPRIKAASWKRTPEQHNAIHQREDKKGNISK